MHKQEVDGFKAIIKLLDDPDVSLAAIAKTLTRIYKAEKGSYFYLSPGSLKF